MSCSSPLSLSFSSYRFLVLAWCFSHPWFSELNRQKSDTRVSGCSDCWWRLGWSDVLLTSVWESSWMHWTGFVQPDPYGVTGQVVLGRQEFGSFYRVAVDLTGFCGVSAVSLWQRKPNASPVSYLRSAAGEHVPWVLLPEWGEGKRKNLKSGVLLRIKSGIIIH